ncbi:MAG TPA: PAS domain S-box protein [Blastocatellia bacterium]|nr:PAS domain S-box protein [Blastocatellia bacterium]
MQAWRTSEQIKAEIEHMFGFSPNFFQPVLGAPEALESLWQDALAAYVNNPLPAVFKEKLFARLSRYCATPYCLVTHSCLMSFLGQSAGEIARVLESPAPASDADIEEPLHTLAAADSPLPVWPEPGSRLEEALLRCSEISFLNARGAAVCRAELRRLLGVVNHTHLIRFLSFVKLAHLWIEAYPEVSYQADERTMKMLAALVRDEPRLADFFNQYPDIVRRERESLESRLSAELAELKLVEEVLLVSEERYRTLVESAPEAILVMDADTGRFVDANENSLKLFRLEREELLKLGPVDVSPFAINGHNARELAAAKIQQALNGGAPVFEWIHRNSAGEDIPCEVRLMRLPGTRNLVRGSITDITERKLAEKAQRKQLAAMEAAPDGIAILNNDEVYTYVNEAHAKIYGYDRQEELIGNTWRLLYFEDEIKRIEQEVMPELWEKGKWQGELLGKRRDGSVFDVDVSLTTLQDDELICVCRDVTERKRAEGMLRESEERIRLILDSTAEAIFGCDPDGTCLFCNRAAVRLLGYDDPGELLGQNMHRLKHHTRADGTPYPVEECPIYLGFQRGEGVHRDNEVYWRKDGTCFPVEFWSHPIVRDGRTTGAVVTFVDITERKRAEDALRQYVERLRIMQEIDRSILAAQSAEEIASVALRRLRDLVPSERVTVALKGPAPDEATVLAASVDGERTVEAGTRLPIEAYGDLSNLIAEKLQRGETYLLDALSVPDPAPAIRELRTKGRRYYFIVPLLAHGELMGSLSLGADSPSDLTAEHLEIAREVADGLAIAVRQASLHEQVGQHAAELEQRVAERTAELEAFSYSVSHDLRTPLLTIDGFSRMLLDDYADRLDAEGQRLLKTICSNSQNMGRLIDDLLAFSRIGRQEMRPAEIKMSELAAAVCAELTATAPERKLKFNLQPLPPARGDQSMIRQVFVNLLSNAIKFTGPKEVAVIEVGAAEEENHNVYYVKDNGVGFEMKYADKLFGVFERLHSEDEFAGTGVGLAFVQRILHRHGGRVWAEGKVGEGATVYFTLPHKGRKSW